MALDDSIKPFKIVQHDESTSVILTAGVYKQDIFDTAANKCFEGSGYDWTSLARVFLDEKAPHLKADIRFDPEADMFSAYSASRQAVEDFAIAFHAACEDDALIRGLLSRATVDD